MTYADLIGQVSRNLGYDGSLAGQLKGDILFAINYALMQLVGETAALERQVEILLNANQERYILPEDCYRPRGVTIRNSAGAALNSMNSEVEEINEYKGAPNDPDFSARYSGKILYGYHHENERIYVIVYPTTAGVFLLRYDCMPRQVKDMNGEPAIHPHFHGALVSGATEYLAIGEAIRIAKQGNPDLLANYNTLVGIHGKKFEDSKKSYARWSQNRSEPAVIQPWGFYELPEKYIPAGN